MRRCAFTILAVFLALTAAYPQEAGIPPSAEGPGQELYRKAYEAMRVRAASTHSACIKVHVAFKFWNPSAMGAGTPTEKTFTYRWMKDGSSWRLERELEDATWKIVSRGDSEKWSLNWKTGAATEGRFAVGRPAVEEILLPPPPGIVNVAAFQKNPTEDSTMVFGSWALGRHPAFAQGFTLHIDGTGPLMMTGSVTPSWDPDLVGQYSVQWTREKPGH